MNEEDMLKRRLLERKMQEQASGEMQQQMQQQQMEEALKAIMIHVLDEKARERLNNLKFVKPQVAMQLQMYLAQLYQSGQLRSKITEEQIIAIMQKISQKKETSIKRK